jgi:hypothetical protein
VAVPPAERPVGLWCWYGAVLRLMRCCSCRRSQWHGNSKLKLDARRP